MRITNSMLNSTFMNGLNRNLNQMKDLNDKMNSGQQVSRPSDDPTKIVKIMNLKNEIKGIDQYNQNIDDIVGWVETTDSSLSDMGNAVNRMKELLVSVGNPSCGPDERSAVKSEINQLINQLNSSLNTTFEGKQIFGGSNISNKTFNITKDLNGNNVINYLDKDGNEVAIDPADPNYINLINQINKELNVEIAPGITVEYNINANEIINFTDKSGTSNLFDVLDDIMTALDDPNANLQDLTSSLDNAADNILACRTEVGAKQNTLENVKEKNEDTKLNLQTLLSERQDVDLAKVWIEYSTALTSYNATLQAGTKMIQPSIMDYLR